MRSRESDDEGKRDGKIEGRVSRADEAGQEDRGGRVKQRVEEGRGQNERVLLAKQICTHVLIHLSPSQSYLRSYSPFKDFSCCPQL